MTHPTDAELAAAIDRGIADGSIIELTPEVLDEMALAAGLNTPPRAPEIAAAEGKAYRWVLATRRSTAHALTDRLPHGDTSNTVCGRTLWTETMQAARDQSRRCGACTQMIASGTGWA